MPTDDDHAADHDRVPGRAGLDPDVAAFLARLRDRGEPAMFDGTVQEARQRFAAQMREAVRPAASGAGGSAGLPADGSAGPPGGTGGAGPGPEVLDGPVPVRLHRPATPSGALAVFVHGGGWVLGGGDAYDAVAARLAADTGAVVAAVDHRLAPEHPFPAPLDDVAAATRWVLRCADRWGADPARSALVGDSAGANLAAVTALALRDAGVPVAAQLLVYPPPDFEARYPSLAENAEGYWLTARDVRTCSKHYLGGHDPRGDVRVSPLRADLAGLPPTIVATAGFDPLRDAGAAFVDALVAAGVDARLREHPSLVHGFYGFTGVAPAADAAVGALHAELADLLAP